MDIRAGQVRVHYVQHGRGRPVLVLHAAGVDHHETEVCFEPVLERYERHVAPAATLVDQVAMGRIAERWAFTRDQAPAYPGPTLVVAGRLDSTVGYAAAADLVGDRPQASLAVVDDAGHALPHERPEVLRALILEWLTRVE